MSPPEARQLRDLSPAWHAAVPEYVTALAWSPLGDRLAIGAADGTLNLTYPNRLGPQGDALNGRFSLRKEVSTVSQVVEVSSPGELKAKATWTGYDQKLSLLIYGPGQVNEYARKEDKSGVTVSFKITPELLKLSNVWYVQLRHDASSQGLIKDLMQLFKTQAGLQGEMTLEIP